MEDEIRKDITRILAEYQIPEEKLRFVLAFLRKAAGERIKDAIETL